MSYVYLEKEAGTNVYRCRGALTENDNFDSFKIKMEAQGFDAFESDELLGREVKVTVNDNGERTVDVLEV